MIGASLEKPDSVLEEELKVEELALVLGAEVLDEEVPIGEMVEEAVVVEGALAEAVAEVEEVLVREEEEQGNSLTAIGREKKGKNMERQNIMKSGMGPGGYCFCPKCGYKKPHVQGVPCRDEKCPECDLNLIRKGSYHDDLIKKKKGGK